MELELDCIEFPFQFDQADELFPLPSLSSLDIPLPISLPQPQPQPPLISNSKNKTNKNNLTSKKPKNGRGRKSDPSTTSDDIIDDDNNPNEHKKKKIIHRDVERQRRQEMSALYCTLRSLLPVEYLKGKRSICDHMHETVKYIQQIQNKIQKLTIKRDELKQHFGEDSNKDTVETLHNSKNDSVVVIPRTRGFQVVLDTATHHRLPVSNLVKSLLTEKLEIISCISIEKNGRLLHTIELDVVDIGSIDMTELQHKLTNLEYFPLD